MELTRALNQRRRHRSTALAASVGLGLALLAVNAPAAQAYGTYELTGTNGALVRADGTTPANLAGEHPDALNLNFGIPDNIQDGPDPLPKPLPDPRPWLEPRGVTEHVRVDLPVGVAANPAAIPTCTDEELFNLTGTSTGANPLPPEMKCPPASQIGVMLLTVRANFNKDFSDTYKRLVVKAQLPVYNMTRGPGQPGRFGFNPGEAPANVVMGGDLSPIDVIGEVRPDDQGMSFTLKAPPSLPLLKTEMVIWGKPGAAAHDVERTRTYAWVGADNGRLGKPEKLSGVGGSYGNQPVEDRTTAFLTNPTSCDGPLTTRVTVRDTDGQTASAAIPVSEGMTGCEGVPFSPSISFGDTPLQADANVPLKVNLHVPQTQVGDQRASAHLREAKVVLPEGFSISPSAATGLEACSDAQLAQGTNDPVACPDSAKVGKISIDSPLIDSPLEGSIYVGQPQPGNRYRLFLVAEGHGVSIRLKGDVHADAATGQLTTTFKDNPQLPFTDLTLEFDGGDRGVIASPQTCGTSEGAASLGSFSARSRVLTSASIEVVGCNGFPFSPGFGVAPASLQSGAFSPLTVAFSRADGNQFLSGISAVLPEGMTAKLKGVQRCAEAQIAAEACPGGSQIGIVSVKAGPGGAPFGLSGPVYLTNGYKGGSFGMVAIIHVVAGPYDLGNVVVRQSLRIDPETAQVTVVSDPLPQIKEGVVLRLRDLALNVNRKDFIRNPTSCGTHHLGATLSSVGGAAATPSAKLDFSGCKDLKFAPKIKLALKNKSQMGKFKHPRLTATVTQKDGEAGLRAASVALPKALALAADNAQGLCETADALKDNCPKASIVGSAKAETPILDKSLKGPVYFVKGERTDPKTGKVIKTLPTLYVPLRGETTIHLRAKTAVSHDRLVTTFPEIPDQPITKFTLSIDGGKHGIIATTRSLCRGKLKGSARFTGQNGDKPKATKPRIGTVCKGSKGKTAKKAGKTKKTSTKKASKK